MFQNYRVAFTDGVRLKNKIKQFCKLKCIKHVGFFRCLKHLSKLNLALIIHQCLPFLVISKTIDRNNIDDCFERNQQVDSPHCLSFFLQISQLSLQSSKRLKSHVDVGQVGQFFTTDRPSCRVCEAGLFLDTISDNYESLLTRTKMNHLQLIIIIT